MITCPHRRSETQIFRRQIQKQTQTHAQIQTQTQRASESNPNTFPCRGEVLRIDHMPSKKIRNTNTNTCTNTNTKLIQRASGAASTLFPVGIEKFTYRISEQQMSEQMGE